MMNSHLPSRLFITDLGTGLAVLVLLSLAFLTKAQAQTVAMTVDDIPYAPGNSKPVGPGDAKAVRHINKALLRGFANEHIPVTGFVIEQYVEQIGSEASIRVLRKWVATGFDLGNHTYSHADANALSADQFEKEIIRGENTIVPVLKGVSRKPQFFRFPYNHTGNTKEKHDAVAAFVAERGYRLAPCTIDNSDYEFNTTYVLAIQRHDKNIAAKLRADYLSYTAAEIDWYSKLDMEVFGREIPHIMLLHDNQLNADTIASIIGLFNQRGYRFVTLADALRDQAYSTPETFITKFGPMWGYRWAKELDVKVNGRDEPEPPKWIELYAREASSEAK